jgi:hypothetical protein
VLQSFQHIFCKKTATERLTGVNSDFNTLIEFLDRLGPEVSGRILNEPHRKEADQLKRFARGKLADGQRTELCAILKLHPVWIRWLADRVKEARPLRSEEVAIAG